MASVDLRGLIRPNDHLIWGQGTAEPLTLSRAVVAQREAIGPISVFVGVTFTETLQPEHTDLIRVSSYGTLGTTRSLAAANALDIIPCHVSQLGAAVSRGDIPCDVALVQLSPPGPNGRHSLGPINDYMRAAFGRARVVIGEINEQLPWTYGDELPDIPNLTIVAHSSYAPAEAPTRPPEAIDRAIASHVADIVPDGATLQVGIGGTIDAVLQCLGSRRDLGVHSGTVGDSVVDLIECGAVTNARKPIDRGVTVAGSLFGTARLLKAADRNPAFRVEPFEYTHNAATLAKIPNLVAINSAIEVDLTGQVNAEMTGGRYIGAVGGQVDYMHAAARAEQGCSIIALPSIVVGKPISRIKPSLNTVTCARSEVDFVITEMGVAALRGQSLRERVRRMLAIAHPEQREALEEQAHLLLKRGF